MKQIIVFPRGQLDSKDRERLTKAGIVVVEADDPSKVVTVLPMASPLSSDDLFRAAMKAIGTAEYNDTRVKFAAAICAAVNPPVPK